MENKKVRERVEEKDPHFYDKVSLCKAIRSEGILFAVHVSMSLAVSHGDDDDGNDGGWVYLSDPRKPPKIKNCYIFSLVKKITVFPPYLKPLQHILKLEYYIRMVRSFSHALSRNIDNYRHFRILIRGS